MNNFWALVLLVFSFFNAVSQQTETRAVGTFSGVKAAEGIDVFLKQGDKEEVKVEVTGTDVSNVVTEVSGSYLKVHRKEGRFRDIQAKVYVTYVELSKLSASSAASIFSETPLKASSIEISASSAGAVEVTIDAASAEISSSSAGDVELKGRAERVSVDASSAGEIDAYDLLAEEVEADASTAGSVKVSVKETLNARASTGGSIRYRGNPDRLHSNSSTGGSIRKTN